MIIWKGHGILIPVFALVGGAGAVLLLTGISKVTHWEWLNYLLPCLLFWGAAAGVWLYALTLGKPTTQMFLDPTTHQPILLQRSHTLYFIPARIWAIIASVVASLTTVVAIVSPLYLKVNESSISGAGARAFEQANNLIGVDRSIIAYGNVPDAEILAGQFSAAIKSARQVGVATSTLSFSNGRFLTYCRLGPDSCAFMVHVPDLRKFSPDAKVFMADMAWMEALHATAALEPQPKRIAIGIRGVFLYDAVIVGHPVAAGEASQKGIDDRYTGLSPESHLYSFFETPPPASTLPTLKLSPTAAEEKAASAPAPSAVSITTASPKLADPAPPSGKPSQPP